MIVWLIGTASAALGAALLIAGLRGRRVDDRPICRKCRFDLSGLGGAGEAEDVVPARCPECGRDLSEKLAVRFGHRRRRRGMVGVGSAALLIGVGVLGASAWSAAVGANFNAFKPVWMLALEARGLAPGRASAALSELVNRAEQDSLSESRLRSLAEQGLALQADEDRPWLPGWGSLIEQAWSAGAISDDLFKKYAQRIAREGLEMRVRDPVRVGDEWPIELKLGPARAADGSPFKLFVELKDVTVDGMRVEPISRSKAAFGMSEAGALTTRSIINPLDMAPGEKTVSATWRIEVREGFRGPTAVDTWTRSISVKTNVVGPDAGGVEVVRDESLRREVESAVGVERCEVRSRDEQTTSVTCYIEFDAPPVGLAFDIVLRADGRTWETASAFAPAGKTGTLGMMGGTDGSFDAERVDVILRPNRNTALKSVNVRRIWGEPIVVEDVDVLWRARVGGERESE